MKPMEIVATRPVMSSQQQEEEWQPNGPCRFQQLPEALFMDILSRLTVMTLFNCRCVCQSWLSSISDPHFALLHRSRSPIGILIKNRPSARTSGKAHVTQIQQCGDSDVLVEEMRFTPKNIPIFEFGLINSCNGLLLVCGAGRDGPFPLYVCNPIFGEFITIPPTTKGRRLGSFLGLGFNGKTNEYKVLQSFYPLNESNYLEVEIYTIGTGVWRSIGNVPRELVELPFNSFLHGALHWVLHRGGTSVFIHSFNFDREQFLPLPLPT